MRPETLDRQIDGDHYKTMGLQPWEIIEKNGLDYFHGAALKYLLRWQDKDGIIDLNKIIHYVEHIKALALSGHYGAKFTPKIAPSYYRSLEEDIDPKMRDIDSDLCRLSLEDMEALAAKAFDRKFLDNTKPPRRRPVKRSSRPKVKRLAPKRSKSKLK